jgi:hypothetical protein
VTPPRHLDFIALMEALGQPGCPACRLAARAERRFLETLFYEQVTDPEMRERLRRSSGFCGQHTAMVLRLGDALGCSIIYADLLDEASKTLKGGDADRCPACRVGANAVTRALSALVTHVSEEDVLAAYRASDGLCLRHLGELTGRSAAGAKALEAIERERLSRLAEECREFVAKSDYRRIGEMMGPERNAWQRAARKLGGGVPENGTH